MTMEAAWRSPSSGGMPRLLVASVLVAALTVSEMRLARVSDRLALAIRESRCDSKWDTE